MSHFTGPQNTIWAGQWYPDERVRLPVDRWWDTSRTASQPWADGLLWPSSRFMCGDPSSDSWPVGNCNTDIARFESWLNYGNTDESGNQVRLKIRGTTRDSTGNPLGSCTVHCLLAATDTLVSITPSDAGGYFEAPSQYPSQNHYLVAYKPGSPDVTGSTVNTLQPS